MTFKIGDMIKLKSANMVGFIIEEDRVTNRYKIQWLTSLQPGISWAAHDRIVKVY